MKKILKIVTILFIFSLLIPVATQAQEASAKFGSSKGIIFITSPANNATFKAGNNIPILIHRSGSTVGATASVVLLPVAAHGAPSSITINSGTKASGINWKVPKIPSGTYQILVRTLDKGISDKKIVRIDGATTPVATSTTPYVFTRNLTVGSSGSDVVVLVKFLQAKGFLGAPTGASTDVYTTDVKNALAAYQIAVGIAPADGVFGALTRVRVNADLASSPTVITPPTGTSTPVTNEVNISKSEAEIPAREYPINKIDMISGVPVLAFVASANNNANNMTTVDSVKISIQSVASTTNRAYPVTVSISDRLTDRVLKSGVLGSDHTITFDNLNSVVLANSHTEYLIKIDMPVNTQNGTIITAHLDDVTFSRGNFGPSSIKLPLVSPEFKFKDVSPGVGLAYYKLSAEPGILNVSDSNTGKTTRVIASYSFTLTAVGGSIKMPTSADFTGIFVSTSRNDGGIMASTITVDAPNLSDLAEGSSVPVVVRLIKDSRGLTFGAYSAKLLMPDKVTSFATPFTTVVVYNYEENTNQKASAFDAVKKFFSSLFGF